MDIPKKITNKAALIIKSASVIAALTAILTFLDRHYITIEDHSYDIGYVLEIAESAHRGCRLACSIASRDNENDLQACNIVLEIR